MTARPSQAGKKTAAHISKSFRVNIFLQQIVRLPYMMIVNSVEEFYS